MAIIQGNAKQGSTRGFYPKIINGSLRFNDDDSAYLSWTPASAGNRKTWTWSGWVKRANLGTTDAYILFDASTADTNASLIEFGKSTEGDTALNVVDYQGGERIRLRTNMKFRDPSAWYHIVVAVDTTQATSTNRVKIYVNGEQQTSLAQTTYPAQNHDTLVNATNQHRFGRWWDNRRFFDGYLANVHFIDGQALTPSDFGETKNGVWVAKDYAGTFGTNGFYLTFEDDTQVEAFNTVLYRGDGNDTQSVSGTGLTPDLVWVKNRSVGDSHVLFDSVRGFGSGKGLQSQNTAAEGANDPSYGFVQSVNSDGFTVSQGTVGDDYVNSSAENYVAWCWDAGANNAVTGHSSVTYTGNGGTQIIKGLPFSPDLIWAKNRVDAGYHHDLYDTVRGDNLRLYSSQTSAEGTGYLEFLPDGFKLTSGGGINNSGSAHVAWAWDAGDSDPVSNTAGTITSTVKTNGDFSIIGYTGNATSGATIGHGLSAAPDFILVKNRDDGVRHWMVYHSSITNAEQKYLFLSGTNAIQDGVEIWNDTAPTDSVISLGNSGETNQSGSDHIAYAWRNVTGKQKFGSYTGTGATGNTVTTGFRPGFLMVKRDGFSHWEIHDGSRDPFANPSTKLLNANQANAEDDNANGSFEFTDTGFIVQTTHEERNFNGDTYIYAAFAGSYSDYITDYNTDGSIDSRVKASDTTGFSVVSYEGVGPASAANEIQVGHGLSAAPDFLIVKNRDAATDWFVFTTVVDGSNDYLYLNKTDAKGDSGNTAPTSSVFYAGGSLNTSGNNYIAYCWTETTGVSKFSTYVGTGADHTSEQTLGFKPAMVIVKNTVNRGDPWVIFDNTRDTDGTTNKVLFPNLSNAESNSSTTMLAISDTGFTVKGTGTAHNYNGDTFIYAAFADTREAAFWLDQSSNDNDWQPNNLDHNDTVADSPTNNFCTLNPVNKPEGTLSDGNLVIDHNGSAGKFIGTTMAVSSGQYYFEAELLNWNATNSRHSLGIIPVSSPNNTWLLNASQSIAYSYFVRDLYQNGSVVFDNTANDTPASGDVYMFAFDLDNNKFYVGKNGTWFNSGNPSTGTGSMATIPSGYTWMVATGAADNSSNSVHNNDFRFNFGQQPFKYGPPA